MKRPKMSFSVPQALKIFGIRKSLMVVGSCAPYSGLAAGHQKFVLQARSAPGSEVRGLGRALRRLIPSKQPLGQLRTQWRCQEKCVTASSSPKRHWNFEIYDGTFSAANTPKRSCSNLGLTLEKAPTSRKTEIQLDIET